MTIDLHWTFWPTFIVAGLILGWVGGSITAIYRIAQQYGWKRAWEAFIATKGWKPWL